MALKPDARTCWIREQLIVDLPSGLTLHWEACEGGTRLVISGRSLPRGEREIRFDADGRALGVGPALKDLSL
jgi:hypothetical protein